MAGGGKLFTNPFLQFAGNFLTGLWAQNEQKKSSAAHPIQSLSDKMGYNTTGGVKFGQPLFSGGRANREFTAGDFTDPMQIATQLGAEGEEAFKAAEEDFQRNTAQADQDRSLLRQRTMEGKQNILNVREGGRQARATLGNALQEAKATQAQVRQTPHQILAQTTALAGLALQKLQQTEQMVTEDRKAWVDATAQQLVAARQGIDSATEQATRQALQAVDEAGGTEYDRQAASRMVKFGAFGNMMSTWSAVAADQSQKYADFLKGTGQTVAMARLDTMSTLGKLADTATAGLSESNRAILAANQAVTDIMKAQAELDVNIPVLEENMEAALRSFEYAGMKDLREFQAALVKPTRGYMGGIMQFTLGSLASLNEESNLIANELFARETGITNTLASAVVGGLQYGMNASMFNQQMGFQERQADRSFGLGVASAGTNLASSMIGPQGLFNFRTPPGGTGSGPVWTQSGGS